MINKIKNIIILYLKNKTLRKVMKEKIISSI